MDAGLGGEKNSSFDAPGRRSSSLLSRPLRFRSSSCVTHARATFVHLTGGRTSHWQARTKFERRMTRKSERERAGGSKLPASICLSGFSNAGDDGGHGDHHGDRRHDAPEASTRPTEIKRAGEWKRISLFFLLLFTKTTPPSVAYGMRAVQTNKSRTRRPKPNQFDPIASPFDSIRSPSRDSDESGEASSALCNLI